MSQDPASPESEFTDQATQIDAFKLFSMILPRWSARHGSSVSIHFQAVEDGVSIGLGLPPSSATQANVDSLFEMLRQGEKMMQLNLLVDQMRGAGVAPEVLDPMIAEAQAIAAQLFPRKDPQES